MKNFNYEFNDESFEFEASREKIEQALKKIIVCEAEVEESAEVLKVLNYIVSDIDIVDSLEEYFEDQLYDYFTEDAKKAYYEKLQYKRDQDDWFGTKNNVIGI